MVTTVDGNTGVDNVQVNTLISSPFLHVQDQKPDTTDGGVSVATTWTTRDLNTIVTNAISGASLASNQITLPAGTYYIDCSSAFYNTARTRTRIRNTTDLSTLLISLNVFPSTSGSDSTLAGRFTLSAEAVLELQYYTSTAQSPDGLGVDSATGEVEIYADVKIWRLE